MVSSFTAGVLELISSAATATVTVGGISVEDQVGHLDSHVNHVGP